MLHQIAQIVARYEELERQMTEPDILADYSKLTELAQERSDIEPIVQAYQAHAAAMHQLLSAQEMVEQETDPGLKEMAQEEVTALNEQLTALEAEMRQLLVPKNPRDDKNVYIEIRAGAGGDEAGLFAADLLRMYTRYAEAQNWKVEIVDENRTGVGGYKEVILQVKGKGAYSRFKYESGVHRVQRVPATESQGRIHTSTITVAVMPELEEVDIVLDDRDLEITNTFSAGPGGQHMQKNATAARVVHKPTGIMIRIQSQRSLTQNKLLALQILQSRLQEMEENKRDAAVAAERKAQVGSGERSEKIRTYNYPQNRVTDHRVGYTSYNLQGVMDGGLEPFIDALTIADQSAKLAALEEK
ncbi:MAG: peptide chain release factor 1 [Chloroflexi bacterium]|nr:peptide chain release factor 1 [Chloroflexota bacterium]MBP8056259.1 peptide chain release factor 1 [Chloroflexota bacterium]